MAEKPSTLFLIALAGIGTAILSPLTLGGEPVAVLILPFALLAAYIYTTETGIVVGIGASLVSTILVDRLTTWNGIIYGLGAGLTVFALETIYPKQKNQLSFILFAGIGTLVLESVNDLYLGNNLLLRPEHFLGTNPVSGIRILINVIVTAILLAYFEQPIPAKK